MAVHEFFNNRLGFFLFFVRNCCLCYYVKSAHLFGGVCQGGGPVLLQRLLRSGSCGENAKCWLSLWHGEVRGPSRWESVHMSPFCYLNRGSLAHLLLSALSPHHHHHLSFSRPAALIFYSAERGKKATAWGGVLLHKHHRVAAD